MMHGNERKKQEWGKNAIIKEFFYSPRAANYN